jgi:purine-binding chemotaxis protein CheW
MASQPSQIGQYLSFRIGDADFGIPLLQVKEILQYETPVPIPGMPPSFRGVMNVRGSAIPVVDLGVRFGRGESSPTKRTCILVVENESTAVPTGVIADVVNEVAEVRAEDVEPPPDFGPEMRVDYLTGMARSGRGFVLLLDLGRVLGTLASPPEAALAGARGEVQAVVSAGAPSGR